MIETRRQFLKTAGTAGACALALPMLFRPGAAWASETRPAFAEQKLAGTLHALGISGATPSHAITLRAPEIAENGAIVPIEVISKLPDTQAIYLLTAVNPVPLLGSFQFYNGAEGYAKVNIKLAKSSQVQVIVKAGGKFYETSQEVKVTIGGCGG